MYYINVSANYNNFSFLEFVEFIGLVVYVFMQLCLLAQAHDSWLTSDVCHNYSLFETGSPEIHLSLSSPKTGITHTFQLRHTSAILKL